jgi:hypothetical protein
MSTMSCPLLDSRRDDLFQVAMSSQSIISTPDAYPIADKAAKARQLLFCCQEMTTEEPQRLAAETQLARFNLWASNIRVFASQHASLDYWLRTAPLFTAVIEGNLEILCKYLLKSMLA